MAEEVQWAKFDPDSARGKQLREVANARMRALCNGIIDYVFAHGANHVVASANSPHSEN